LMDAPAGPVCSHRRRLKGQGEITFTGDKDMAGPLPPTNQPPIVRVVFLPELATPSAVASLGLV